MAAVSEAVGASRAGSSLWRRAAARLEGLLRVRGQRTGVSSGLPRVLVTEAEVAGLLEPSVGVKEPVRRLHAVVGDDEHRRLLAPKPLRLLDQTPAGGIDRLVDLYQLVPGLVRSVRRMGRVETRCQARWPAMSELMKSTHRSPSSGSSSSASKQTSAISWTWSADVAVQPWSLRLDGWRDTRRSGCPRESRCGRTAG